jgi:predicted phosphodiesterase
VQGIVTGIGFNNGRYFIGDESGGPWSGLYIYNITNQPSLGDFVRLTGTVTEYYDFTEITSVSAFQVLSQNNPLPPASVIDTATLSSFATAEAWESVLVEVQNVSVTQNPNVYQEFYVSDGSGECQIDNGFFSGSHTWQNIQNGTVFTSITGIVDYAFSTYCINPRSLTDMVMDGAAVSLHLPHLTTAVDAVVSVPLDAHNLVATQGYRSYSFDLYYDPAILQYQNVSSAGTLSQTGTVNVNSNPGNLNISYQSEFALHGTGTLLNFSFFALSTGRTDLNLNSAFFAADPIEHIINGSVTVNGNYNTLGDTLTVIQRPILNIPAIHIPGETMTITCLAPQSTTGFNAWLRHNNKRVSLALQSSTWLTNPNRWELQVTIPQVAVFELYDLEVNAAGGIHDITRNAVQVLPSRKNNYYFVQITDLHLPNRLYYPNPGYDTDSTSVVDFRAVMDDINLIRPEFVLLTGDLINEGELENFSNQFWYGWTQRVLSELEVPVYVTSGNHDIGGWNATPPPSGSSRRNWWRYFGWSWLDNTDVNWPYHTQDYHFTYNNTLYVGLEAYNNYDNFRSYIYGSDSFTNKQLSWLNSTLAAYPEHQKVLFHHYDFQGQLSLGSLGVDMALLGHTHSNSGSISFYPFNLSTRSVCDGNRAYRVVRVSENSFAPLNTIYAGSNGANINISYLPANNATADSVMAVVRNNQPVAFENALVKFKMPSGNTGYEVVGGVLEQVDRFGEHNVCYVRVNLTTYSTQNVSISATGVSNQDATLIPSPMQINGIHPNPLRGNGKLELYCDQALRKVSLELFNLKGQKVQDLEYYNLVQGNNDLPLMTDLRSGIYFVKIKDIPGKAYKLVIMK